MTDDIEGYAKWQREFYDTHSRVPEPIDLWNSARAQADSQAPVSEPIYQTWDDLDGGWYDQSESYYNGYCDDHNKRIVYTAPPQAVVAQPVDEGYRSLEYLNEHTDEWCRLRIEDIKAVFNERKYILRDAVIHPQVKAGDNS